MTTKQTSPKIWVMDLETIVNCFVGVFVHLHTSEKKVFTISPYQNNLKELIDFLQNNITNKDWHLGINNLNFDSQIIEFILDSYVKWTGKSNEEIAQIIYNYAQLVIKRKNEHQFSDYPEFKLRIKCFDIFRLNHWNNKAKSTSLKWAQYSMDWYNIEEMPHPHYQPIKSVKEQNEIIAYCENDVLSTKGIVYLKDSKGNYIYPEQLKLRTELSAEYNLNLYSAPEPKIASEIFLYYLCKKLDIDKKYLRSLRTQRSSVNCGDIIFPYVKFQTPEFEAVKEWYSNLLVDTTEYDGDKNEDDEKGPKFILKHKQVKTVYGLGGIHGCVKKGVYTSNSQKVIVSADVVSFYPRLAIQNKLAPEHLPKDAFCELYDWFFHERTKYPKGSALNYLFKIILNSTYGLSKSKFSFFYDPKLTFTITINGQLLLSMLYEMISLRIPNSIPLMQNTDGLEFMIDRKDLDLYHEICAEWERLTGLNLEFVKYQKMIIADVNNYIAVYENGKTKCKGRFEFEDIPLHKNKSMLIIPKAIYNYFIHNIPVEDTIYDNCNIYDFCAGVKLKSDWFFKEYKVEKGKLIINTHKKILRYYMSNKGSKIIKSHPDGRNINLDSGKWYQTIFNVYKKKEWADYDIDYKYYINLAYKEIDMIESSTNTFLPSNESWKQTQMIL